MSARTRILGILLALILAAAVIAVHYLNETTGRIIIGLIAGASLARWGRAMAVAFTTEHKGGEIPERR